MKKFIISAFFLLSAFMAMSQQQFVVNGVIEYERHINLHRQFETDDDDGGFWKDFLSKQPKFYNSYFNLSFNKEQSVYKPGREGDKDMEPWLIGPAKKNIVYTNFNSLEYRSRRKVFEENFEIVDTLSKIKWRLTTETRTIAGFECRKAVGIICDSVYITAFYTDEIPVSGGPESFGGLPGMILGLAVPRLYSTWFATKVELTDPPAASFEPVKAGKQKKMTAAAFAPFLKDTFTDWGARGAKNIWWSML